MATLKVQKYEFEKVLKDNVEVNIPEEPIFTQAWNHRVITGIFPIKADWENGDGKVWRLYIVRIAEYENIQTALMDVNPKALADLFLMEEVKNKCKEDALKLEVLDYLTRYYNEDRVSENVFKNKFTAMVEHIEYQAKIKF